MKTIKTLLALALFLSVVACNGQTPKPKATVTDKIEVYYFHFTARCLTCNTVEAEAKKNVETLYPEIFKTGKITFKSLNLDEKQAESFANSLDVNGQTLMLVKGNRQINITTEAFLYARSDPEKFRKIMKDKIDQLR